MDSDQIWNIIREKYPNMEQAILKQNWYSVEEFLEDMSDFLKEYRKTVVPEVSEKGEGKT